MDTYDDVDLAYYMKRKDELDRKLVGTKVVTYDANTKTEWTGTYKMDLDGYLYIPPDGEVDGYLYAQEDDETDSTEVITKYSKQAFDER